MSESVAQPVKIPADLLARVDAMIEPLAARPDLTNYTRATRAAVVRLALVRGLEALAAELGAPAPAPVAPPRRRRVTK